MPKDTNLINSLPGKTRGIAVALLLSSSHPFIDRGRRGETIMMSIRWKNAATWGLVGLMFLLYWLVFGPVQALAGPAPYDAALYEVTEDMYLKDSAGKFVMSPLPDGRRVAVARLAGWARLGTPLCPSWVANVVPGTKKCNVNATGADDLSLATRKGTLAGSYTVTVQDDNKVDSPEFVVMSGTFKGDADLSPVE